MATVVEQGHIHTHVQAPSILHFGAFRILIGNGQGLGNVTYILIVHVESCTSAHAQTHSYLAMHTLINLITRC